MKCPVNTHILLLAKKRNKTNRSVLISDAGVEAEDGSVCVSMARGSKQTPLLSECLVFAGLFQTSAFMPVMNNS